MNIDIPAWWLVAVFAGVLWTLVVFVYDAARNDVGSAELWARGAFLIAAATILTLLAAGVIR